MEYLFQNKHKLLLNTYWIMKIIVNFKHTYLCLYKHIVNMIWLIIIKKKWMLNIFWLRASEYLNGTDFSSSLLLNYDAINWQQNIFVFLKAPLNFIIRKPLSPFTLRYVIRKCFFFSYYFLNLHGHKEMICIWIRRTSKIHFNLPLSIISRYTYVLYYIYILLMYVCVYEEGDIYRYIDGRVVLQRQNKKKKVKNRKELNFVCYAI